MTSAIGSTQDAALQPAAAASQVADAGVLAARKALDQEELQGREAVQLIKQAARVAEPRPGPEPRMKGRLVDRTA